MRGLEDLRRRWRRGFLSPRGEKSTCPASALIRSWQEFYVVLCNTTVS